MNKFLPKSFNNPQGFTLVELMVVITIIGILSVIGMTVFTGVQKNARDAKRRADIDAISKALESRYNGTKDQNCTANAGTYCAPVAAWFSGSVMPKDPQTDVDYSGLPSAGATTYNVCADLEKDGRASADANPNDYCATQQQ